MLAAPLKSSNDSLEANATITRMTRVLILSDHPTATKAVTKNLRKLGFDVQLALFDGQTLSAIPKQAPEAVLCHLVDYAEQGPKLAKVIQSHFKSKAIPIIGAMSRPSTNASSGFDSTLFAPMHASQIANRVNAMIRLGIMEQEIERRVETLRVDFGRSPDLENISPDRKFRVLFIGKASPSFMIIINALQDKGVDVIAAFTSFSAFDYLHGDPFDAVVMNALEQLEPAFSISEAMRRNPKLYHTPTLFLVNEENFNDHDAAYERGARDIINIKAEPEEISGRILELANYHRIHEQMKSNFISLAIESARDDTSAAYSRRFMRAHLPRMLRDAEKSNQTTTLMGLKLNCSATGDVTDIAIADAYAKTTELIGNLVRMQDVVCRWDEDIFVLAFLNTIRSEAQSILDRIRALLECAVYDSGTSAREALSISATSTLLEIKPGTQNGMQLDVLIGNLIQDPDEA